VRVKGRMLVTFPETEIDLGEYDTSRRIVSGYPEEDGRLAPYAEYRQASTRV